jgi:hypothetical protein
LKFGARKAGEQRGSFENGDEVGAGNCHEEEFSARRLRRVYFS